MGEFGTSGCDQIMTRLSKCAQSRTAPLQWHYYRDPDGHRVVWEDELGAMFDPALPASTLKYRLATFRSLTEEAAFGELDYSGDDLKPVVRDPELWELRWETEDGSPWRMYHAEPDRVLPGHLVSLRIHVKEVKGTQEEIRDRQNDHIEVASDRFREGEPRTWGL